MTILRSSYCLHTSACLSPSRSFFNRPLGMQVDSLFLVQKGANSTSQCQVGLLFSGEINP